MVMSTATAAMTDMAMSPSQTGMAPMASSTGAAMGGGMTMGGCKISVSANGLG